VDSGLFFEGQEACVNPFYKPATWENEAFLSPGDYGVPPSEWFDKVVYGPFILLGIGFIMNHLIHNRGGKNEQKNANASRRKGEGAGKKL
jgi:hypothetical protein